MNYRENERKKAVSIRDSLFRDPGDGVFFNKEREFVLQDPSLNLWAGIRDDAIKYFDRNDISWWKGEEKNEPTGHLLSSQVACVNHLYFMRQRKDVASAVLMNISDKLKEAVVVDDGYVEFEAIGKENYLNERSHTRGANSTSVDAIMVGKKEGGKNVLVMIEWKYTEEYGEENKCISARSKIYDKLLSEEDCPIKASDYESLYYEPFYQLMRQTLLGWKMVQANEYGCDEFIHVHVIPEKNKELRDRVTSPKLAGTTLSDAWKGVLREPERYDVMSPEELTSPVAAVPDTHAVSSYLAQRYWSAGV